MEALKMRDLKMRDWKMREKIWKAKRTQVIADFEEAPPNAVHATTSQCVCVRTLVSLRASDHKTTEEDLLV